MLRGYFNEQTGRPQIDSHIEIYELHIGGPISFLIDTGADRTVLMPSDALRMGLDYSLLAQEHQSTSAMRGIGGAARFFSRKAVIIIDNSDDIFIDQINIEILQPENLQDTEGIPSLLGRDVLKNWRMDYWPTNQKLTFY